MNPTPFDHQPDPELGRLLREQLTGPAPEAFLGRLRVALAGAGARESEWEVLDRWARPRVLAAAIAAALLLALGTWQLSRQVHPDDPDLTASLGVHTMLSAQPPSRDDFVPALLLGGGSR
jgi:hypothetical protein